MIRYFLTTLLLLGAQLAFSQFKGIVIDQTTRQSLADVHVAVINSALGTITDKEGKFVLDNLSSDSIRLRISAIGYSTVEYVMRREKESIIELIPSAILLNNAVTITAQRSERLSFDVAQSTSSISATQLAERSPRSTPEALMNESGVWVQKTNHGGGSPIIRGLVGNQVLLVVDGIRLNNATYRYGPNQYLSTIDPGLIDRIEVNRGSGSVLYGSDALGGVVHVISATPSFHSNGLQVGGRIQTKWMSAGMEQSIRPEIELRGKQIAFLGGFSARNFGDVVAGGDLGVLNPTRDYERSGDAKLLLRTGAQGVLTAAFQQTTQNHVPRYDQVVQGGFAVFEFEPQIRQLSYLRWESSTKSPLLRSFRLTTSVNRSIEGTISQKNNSTEIKKQLDEVNTFGAIAEVQSNPIAKWHVQSGIEFYSDKVNSKSNLLNTTTNTETSQRGSYADGSTISNLAIFTNHQLDWKKFQFSAGARFNNVTVSVVDNVFGNQQINPSAWVGNAGVMYKINSNWRMIGSVNTGFRAPNVDDMSKFGTLEANVFEIPSGSLSPERSLNVESGFKYSSAKLSWTITAYQTKLTDLIDRVTASYNGSTTFDGRTVYQKQNLGEALVKGVEADIEALVVKSLTVFGNVTYTHGENVTKKEPMRRIPPVFGRVGFRYTHPSGVWIRTEWAIARKQDRLAAGDKSDVRIKIRLIDEAMPAWDIVNLYAGYSFKFVSVQISAQNIFDKAYRVYASGIDGYGRCMTASLNIKI
ncbi:MAG: TonB-dependent receptor [Cytophagales bacterium]|jgi:hemoglobin/transferrin/lactoferrin receptor protein|nr:TonB-dependent receptor [Cytophagales bacterium]MCA6387405.1 TonB-dependent receptor [Cytophagales bacterium]MCA6390190.1 TonB-dependent receptor [Cytophagales bacterium]MCA6394986.1 TonB-dependent receptor [Cytophagales bacterium]MCA6397892.1 TonB-dependent receptor [Cytophagales bacterium]